jgi:hypothetical protein
MLLSCVKAKPAQKIETKINSVEDWLKSLALVIEKAVKKFQQDPAKLVATRRP